MQLVKKRRGRAQDFVAVLSRARASAADRTFRLQWLGSCGKIVVWERLVEKRIEEVAPAEISILEAELQPVAAASALNPYVPDSVLIMCPAE